MNDKVRALVSQHCVDACAVILAPGAGEAIRTPDPNLGKVMLYP